MFPRPARLRPYSAAVRRHQLCLVSLLLAATADAQSEQPAASKQRTPPQPFFAWSRLEFPTEEYVARRAAMLSWLKRVGGGVMLIPAGHGRSHGETFRQLDDFLYFTGLEIPQSMLALDSDANTATLFLPPTDKRFENVSRRNDFPGRALVRDPAIGKATGTAEVQSITQLEARVATWVANQRVLFVNPGTPKLRPMTTAWITDTPPIDNLRRHLSKLHPSANLRSAYLGVAELRMIKSEREIEALRSACDITCKAIVEAAQAVAVGVDERTLEGVLELGFKKRGSQRRAFDSIIKSGPNSLWPWRILASHYDRRNRAMRNGDLVIFDVGCEFNYYVTDVGRTFPANGSFRKRQREILAISTAAADAIIAAAKPGTTLRQLLRIAYDTIPSEHRRYMQTGSFFGHHVGLSTGDPTSFSAPLQAGMVFTVEPWYYNHDEQIAVFVEDMIVITEHGCENLTAQLPRSAEQLEALMKPPRAK